MGHFPHQRPRGEPLLPQTKFKNVANSKKIFKTIPCFKKKKNQFYTLAVIAFGGQGLATIGYGDHGLAAKFHDTQDLFLKTLIANWSQGSCHLPW
jgi:hypothetical protein